MAETTPSGGDNEGVRRDTESEGDEGRRAAQVAPDISEQAHGEQTQHAAPDEDVGVPPDEEMNQPGG